MFKFTKPLAAALVALALLVNPIMGADPAEAAEQTATETPAIMPTSFVGEGTLTTENTFKQLPSQAGANVSATLNSKIIRPVEIQELNPVTGEWVTKATAKTMSNSISVRLPRITNLERTQFRVHIPAIRTYGELTSPIQTVETDHITVNMEWVKVLDDRLTLDASTGFYSEMKVVFSKITKESVGGTVTLMSSEDDGRTWEEVVNKPITEVRVENYFIFKDADHYLSKGKVLYKTVFTPLNTSSDILPVPVESDLQSVSYSAASESSILNSTLKGGTLTKPAENEYTVTGSISPVSERGVSLEEYDPKMKIWKEIKKTTTAGSNGSFSFKVPANTSAQTLRVASEGNKAVKAVSTPSTTVNRNISPVAVNQMKQSDRNEKMVPWVAKTITFQPIYNEGKITATLQKYVNKKWVNVSAKTYNTKPKTFDVTTPKGTTATKSGSTTYRVHVSATKFQSAGVSKNFTVVWENPNHYTGYKKTAYDYSKKYCPTILIKVDSKAITRGAWGEVALGTNIITIYSAIPSKHFRTVMYHECGHHKQWELYQNDWDVFLKKANQIYGQKGTVGMEQNADCIANSWAKNSYFGYKGDCKGAKGNAGKLIANGKRI